MGLSEQEQKLLDELERSLGGKHSANPTRKLDRNAVSAKRIILGSLLAATGIAVLVSGVISRITPLGIAGFALMLGGVYLAASTPSSK